MYFICKYIVWHTYDIYNSITGRRAYVIVLVRGTARQLRYGIIQYSGLFSKGWAMATPRRKLSNDYIYTVQDATNVINLSCLPFYPFINFPRPHRNVSQRRTAKHPYCATHRYIYMDYFLSTGCLIIYDYIPWYQVPVGQVLTSSYSVQLYL